MISIQDNPVLDGLAATFLRKHRHTVDTSEAYDDLRQLLAEVQNKERFAVIRWLRFKAAESHSHLAMVDYDVEHSRTVHSAQSIAYFNAVQAIQRRDYLKLPE